MNYDMNFARPKWIKVLIGILSAWVSFTLSVIVLLAIILIFQKLLSDLEIEGTIASIFLIAIFIISAFVSFRITKWQNKYLDKKSLKTNYNILVILILLAVLTIPAPIVYINF